MALSCILRNSLKHIKVNPLKNVVLQNQLRLSSCVSKMSVFSHSQPPLCTTKQSQLSIVKQISTSAVLQSAHGDHSKIWTIERALAATMAALCPAALIMPNKLLDTLMAVAIVMHMHWGIEAIVLDYVRPVIFGTVVPKIGLALVYALSIATLAGLLNFIFNDVGIANGIRLLWKL